jgi:tetraacyldisaccharide 4'-kinase
VTESSAVEKWLMNVWYGNASGGAALLPFTGLYAAVTAIRHQAYRAGWLHSHRVDRPVIVVGNLTVGGTGKTPLVAWLAQRLIALGIKVAVVSRGYGSHAREPVEVTALTDWREVGDEPVLLSRRAGCDVFVSPDRVAAAEAALKHGADVIVSDDGLQHLRLARDFEIAVVDGARGLGNQRLLPAGPLREGAGRLAKVDLVVLNGDAEAGVRAQLQQSRGRSPITMRLTPGYVQSVAPSAPGAPPSFRAPGGCALQEFRGQRVHAVAGIGNPDRFFRMLRSHGIDVIEHAFPDHHPFTQQDLAFADGLPVLMTEKDAVRCASIADERMGYVPVTAEISEADEQTFLEHVFRALNASLPAKR